MNQENVMSEERELLNELKREEQWWKYRRWVYLALSLSLLFAPSLWISFGLPFQISALLSALLISRAVSQWNGDPKNKLLIKLYEEKLEAESTAEAIRAARIEALLTGSPQGNK
jgi:hypothetical protein